MNFSSRARHGRFTRLATTALASTLFTLAAQAASPQVGVSVSINQPGFYGRVDIGDQPPVVIYPQPVIIQQTPVGMHQRPIYMHVPPAHSRDWARYCSHYRACGQPVYFVRDMPRAERYEGRDGRGEERYDRRDERHDGRRDHGNRGDDRGERGGERGHGRDH